MKALVYHGPGQKSWDTVADPAPAEPTDIVVQIDTTTICGTDLHILKGDVPAVTDGRILGHEAVGTVTAVGSAVSTLVEGDRVLVPAITSCGRCAYCKRAMPSHCQATGGIGWIFGHLIDGTQAEYALWGARSRPMAVTWRDRCGVAVGHNDRPGRCVCSI
jgi:alcohol dehydrogenase